MGRTPEERTPCEDVVWLEKKVEEFENAHADHVAFWAKHSHQPDDYNTITITVYKHTMTGAIRAADHPPGNPASWVVLYTFQHEVTNT